jgi:hypothetical protein
MPSSFPLQPVGSGQRLRVAFLSVMRYNCIRGSASRRLVGRNGAVLHARALDDAGLWFCTGAVQAEGSVLRFGLE